MTDEQAGRAALYGYYLRHVLGYDVADAAALVLERYPAARSRLEPLLRRIADEDEREERERIYGRRQAAG